MSNNKSIVIIGAGFAGLAAGIYARLNGYKAQIFEMHDIPGGLCTSWTRKGYTFDVCIHWLVGSSPKSGLHDLWEETGIAKNRKFIDSDEYFRVEEPGGRTLVFYTDVDRLEKNLLEFSPQDEKPIREFISGIRLCLPFDPPSKHDNFLTRLRRQISSAFVFISHGKKLKEWSNTTTAEFAEKFRDPMMAEAFRQMWVPEFSMLFMLFTFGYMHKRNAGYPIGGSKPMADALETRFRELGGEIKYKTRVSKIITENGVARGISLENGTEIMADRVISAADGHSTLYEMLEDKYGDSKSRLPYEKWPIFPSLIFVSLGINRRFDDEPKTISGLTYRLKEPVKIGDQVHEMLSIHIYNHDASMAPDGKTTMTVMVKSDYNYWKELAKDRKIYLEKKEEVGRVVAELLEQRFPGITPLIEVTDVATPLTFERYTGNWKGTFEGWLITPDNADVMIHPMPQTLTGLRNFYMCGQWVEPGGGLPTAIMSAKRLLKAICKEDSLKFKS